MTYLTIGTARIAATMVLNKIPNFMSISRLVGRSGEVIEFLPSIFPYCTAAPEILAAGTPARTPRRTHPAQTSASPSHSHASLGLRAPDVPRLRWYAALDRSSAREMIRLRSSRPSVRHVRPDHGTTNNRSQKPQFRAKGCRESSRNTVVDLHRARRPDSMSACEAPER